jgi:hypothetical protein
LAFVDGRSTFALMGAHAAGELQQAPAVCFGAENLTSLDRRPGCP